MPDRRPPAKSFQDLLVWRKAHELVLAVYTLTAAFPKPETHGLSLQIRRSAVSVAANIAEGFRRRSRTEKGRFLNMAESSLEETRYFLILARDLGYSDTAPLVTSLEELVMRFLAVLATAFACVARLGPILRTATPYDGSAVYFTSSLRIKGTNQPNHGKVFVADERGVRLVRSREKPDVAPPNYQGNCIIGGLYVFRTLEVSADAQTIAALGFRATAGECHGPGPATLIIAATGDRDIPGAVRISANGRYAIVDTTANVFSSPTAAFLDLATGTQKEIPLNTLGSGLSYLALPQAGRAIADDGTAVFSVYQRTIVARPNKDPQPWAGAWLAACTASWR